jgi:hypothetical protein
MKERKDTRAVSFFFFFSLKNKLKLHLAPNSIFLYDKCDVIPNPPPKLLDRMLHTGSSYIFWIIFRDVMAFERPCCLSNPPFFDYLTFIKM